MKYLSGQEEARAISFLQEAARVAGHSTCLRPKGGSIIVAANEVIGRGFNSPPGNLESQRRCLLEKSSYDPKITDKTCCIHAEQRAISDAQIHHASKIPGSTIYYIRLDPRGNPSRAGDPYCTICSKAALDAGIAEFVLWREQGVCVYSTEEYNDLSYQYGHINSA